VLPTSLCRSAPEPKCSRDRTSNIVAELPIGHIHRSEREERPRINRFNSAPRDRMRPPEVHDFDFLGTDLQTHSNDAEERWY
jgi:hypothetical protein